MVSEHVGRPLAGSCAERRYSNSVGSTAVGELLAAANDVGQKRFVAVPAAASSRAKRSHRPPVRDEVISRRPHWRPRPMRQSCPSDPGFLGGGAVTSAYKTLLRSSSAHRAGTLMMLGPYLRARIVVATCRLVQPFPTYGDRSSFQPSPDEMTLNRSQHSSRIECWSGGARGRRFESCLPDGRAMPHFATSGCAVRHERHRAAKDDRASGVGSSAFRYAPRMGRCA